MGTSVRAKNPFLFNSLVKLKHLHRKYSRKPFSRRRFPKCQGLACRMGLGNACEIALRPRPRDLQEAPKYVTHVLRPKYFQVPAPSNARISLHLVTKSWILYSSMSPFAWILNSMSFHIISGWYTEFPYWVLDNKWWERKSKQKVTRNANNWAISFYNIKLANVPSSQEPGITFGSLTSVESSQWLIYVRVLACRDDHSRPSRSGFRRVPCFPPLLLFWELIL